jgi:hypothetical protein
LVSEIENGNDLRSSSPIGAAVTQNIYGQGDNTVNKPIKGNDQLFVRLREEARSIPNETDRENILGRVDELEKAQGSNDLSAAFQRFVASASKYMAKFEAFIPALTQMLSGSRQISTFR